MRCLGLSLFVFMKYLSFLRLVKLIMKVIDVKWIACRIAECFAFLVCTKWSNPVIHRSSLARETGSSSTTIRYLDWNSGLVVAPEEDRHQDRLCGLQDIGGHMLKIPLIVFQVVLCMYLEVYTTCLSNLPYLSLDNTEKANGFALSGNS